MKKPIQYSIIGSIAFVMFIGGFFSYSVIGQQNENNLTQSLALGGYGVIKAYHADGTLFYEWEGHNALTPSGIHTISSCFSSSGDGLPLGNAGHCTFGTSQIVLLSGNSEIISNAFVDSDETLLPEGCDPVSFTPLCTGWFTRATIDFTNLSCTPGVDCPILNEVQTWISSIIPFNTIDVTPQEITPGDIIVVTMTFTPS